MIVRETREYYVMTTQHDHAKVSGEISRWFLEKLFSGSNIHEVILAIEQHDRGWIRLDYTPIWNDHKEVPFSFMDYPLLPKLLSYKSGLDEVESMNTYAGLLCSLHYTSFNHIKRSTLQDCLNFLQYEKERQEKIKMRLGVSDESIILRHFKLLQLCDEISLYICMNEPGVKKENEHVWYKNGFETVLDVGRIQAQWINKTNIIIHPFLFKKDFNITLKSKHVPKELVRQIGISNAYQNTPWSEQEIYISSNPRSQ